MTDELHEGAAPISGTGRTTRAPILHLHRGTVTIGPARLLDEVNLQLAPGTVTGLIGSNGAGKSTLLKVLARQQVLSSGEYLLAGQPGSALGSREFSQRVAYLPQSIPATHGLTVDELVCMGRYPWHGALGRFTTRDRTAVDQALATTRTYAFADRLTDTLSGGERQRCWIAMLLAQEAGVLLLDEPVSALDVRYQIETMDLVRRVSRERGIAILIILHDINLAARYCDEVMALKSGRMAWQGPARNLVDVEVLESIYETPMTVVSAAEAGQIFAFATLSRADRGTDQEGGRLL